MRYVLRKRLGAGISGVIREISDVMVRFVTYSVAVLVSTAADGFAKFQTRAEITVQFPLLLGRFLGQLDDRVMLQIGWIALTVFVLLRVSHWESNRSCFSILPVGWQGWFMACGHRITIYSKTSFFLIKGAFKICLGLYHDIFKNPRVLFDEKKLSAERKTGNGRMVVVDDLLQLRIEILFRNVR